MTEQENVHYYIYTDCKTPSLEGAIMARSYNRGANHHSGCSGHRSTDCWSEHRELRLGG
jgi:hypothetical protein